MSKENEVIKWLKQFKRIPTSRFVGLLNLEYEAVKKILDALEDKKIIKKTVETNSTYWELI